MIEVEVVVEGETTGETTGEATGLPEPKHGQKTLEFEMMV